jgi:hypothetical protein
MSIRAVTRRAALSALGVLALAPAAAMAKSPVRFRSIEVDVGPLRVNVGDPTAAWVAEALPSALAQAFGPYLAPGDRNGATVVARIDWVYLGPNSGTGALGSSQDTIVGGLIVHGPRGLIAPETPLRAISPYFQNPVDQALVVQSNHDRIVALAQAFAYWAPRQLGL